jgi:hypothetical protein
MVAHIIFWIFWLTNIYTMYNVPAILRRLSFSFARSSSVSTGGKVISKKNTSPTASHSTQVARGPNKNCVQAILSLPCVPAIFIASGLRQMRDRLPVARDEGVLMLLLVKLRELPFGENLNRPKVRRSGGERIRSHRG